MTGLKKEIRALAWPASAVAAAVILPAVWPLVAGNSRVSGAWPADVALSVFVVGTAFLVALPLGAEFQQRTLALVLSQPVSRMRVWVQKWGALAAVLLVLTAVQAVASARMPDASVGFREASLLLALGCSGPLWTLVARSTIGGAAFSLAALALVEMTSSAIVSRVTGLALDPFATHPALISVRAAYALGTLWLGWRMFLHYELKAQGESTGVLPVGVLDAIPGLRCRPAGAISNLVRKELRLQQPTVLIATLFVLAWLAAMALFSMPPERPALAEIAFTTLFISYVPLLLIVCGTTSIGEDTSLGIRGWHLTLPVSSATQWRIKLAITSIVGLALGVGLPLALKRLALLVVALPAGSIQLPAPTVILIGAVALLVISFWSATLFGHTVKAALATAVIAPLLWACVVLASVAGQRSGIGNEWLTSLIVANGWSPDDLISRMTVRRFETLVIGSAVAAFVLLAMRQSLMAFRTSQITRGRIFSYALQLVLSSALVSFVPSAYDAAARNQFASQPVRELQAALKKISAAALAERGEIPGEVNAAELGTTGLLSEDSRRWLGDSRIRLRSSAPRTTRAGEIRYVRTEVSFPSGSTFRMLFTVP